MISYFFKNVKFSKINLEKIQNYSSQQKYIQSFMPTLKDLHNCKCPKCGCIDNFSFHCTYDRNLSFVLNSEVVNYVVTVTRVICNSCSSTHAILPDFIVPYKIMSFCSICNIVKDAVSSSVLTISNKLKISYQLVYYYISLVKSFFPDVRILNNNNNFFDFNEYVYLVDFICSCDSSFCFDYYCFFKWYFLMDKFRNDTSCSIYIGSAVSRST